MESKRTGTHVQLTLGRFVKEGSEWQRCLPEHHTYMTLRTAFSDDEFDALMRGFTVYKGDMSYRIVGADMKDHSVYNGHVSSDGSYVVKRGVRKVAEGKFDDVFAAEAHIMGEWGCSPIISIKLENA